MTVTQISFLSSLYLWHLPVSQLQIFSSALVLLQMGLKHFPSAGTQNIEVCESTGRPYKAQGFLFLSWCLILPTLAVQPGLPVGTYLCIAGFLANGMRYLS